MSEWTYSIGDHPDYHTEDSRYGIPTRLTLLEKRVFTPGAASRDFEIMAEHCAEDWHDNHDGWEASWPQEVRIYENDVQVAVVSVERDLRPYYSGYQQIAPTPEPAKPEGEL